MTNNTIDNTLKQLDPTDPITSEQQIRGNALLDRTLATPQPPRKKPVRTMLWRTAGIVSAATAVALGAMVLTSSTGGGDAFANYTPIPEPLTPEEVAAVDAKCRPHIQKWADSEAAEWDARNQELKEFAAETGTEFDPLPEPFDPNDAMIALAERRGDVVVLAYAGQTQSFSMPCDALMRRGSLQVKHASMNGMTGSSYPRSSYPISPDAHSGSSAHQRPEPGTGGLFDLRTPKVYSTIQGRVGTNVAGVTVHTQDIGDVQATVNNGLYTAWWPGEAWVWPEDIPMKSGRDRSEKTYTVSITLKDGTVVKDAPQEVPANR